MSDHWLMPKDYQFGSSIRISCAIIPASLLRKRGKPMGVINLVKSEQDFYDSVAKQANEHIERAKSEASSMVSDMLKSIYETHDTEVPQQWEPVKNKKGRVIAMIWGKEQKDWREGVLQIEGAVYPPGFPIKPKPAATNGAPASSAGAPAIQGAPAAPPAPSETVAPPPAAAGPTGASV
jgi:hypothetical protein